MQHSPSIRDLVIGTHNRKKGAELAEMLAPLPPGSRRRILADNVTRAYNLD